MKTMDETSLLAAMDPAQLLLALLLLCGLGCFCARRFRGTNDFAKSVKLYLPLMVAADLVIVLVFQMDIFVLAGMDICGFLTMALVSNHYFYHD